MAVVTVRTELEAPAEVIWRAVGTPEAFVHVAGAMARFPAAERHGRPWAEGDEIAGWTLLGRVVPFSFHHLAIAELDQEARRLVSNERGGLITRWDHVIQVTERGPDRCAYVDEIVIEAGAMTPVVVAYAHVFYRYRQRRWRTLARVLAAATRGGREATSV